MFSERYPSWGCRCCDNPEGSQPHSLWSLYDVTNCGSRPQPRSSQAKAVQAKDESDGATDSVGNPAASAGATHGKLSAKADIDKRLGELQKKADAMADTVRSK